MPTFQALCEELRESVGVAGTITTVTGQTGIHLRLINYIIKADTKIQRAKANWKFLWSEWKVDLSTEPELSPPSGLAMFDQTSFFLDAGTAKAQPLVYKDYKEWRNLRNVFLQEGVPLFVTIKPNGKVALLPPPVASLTPVELSADYWRKPVPLVNNSQISLIPEHFHSLIIAQAKIYHAEKSHNSGLFASASMEYQDIYRELKAHSLPGYEDDGKSESSLNHVIEVL